MVDQSSIRYKPARFKKSGGYFILIVLIQVLAFILNIPDYIPEWQTAIIVITGVLYFVAVILLGFWIWRTYENQKVKANKQLSLVRVAAGSLGILFWMAVTFAFTGLFFDLELYGNKYVTKYPFPEAGKTIYVYDDSWFTDASTFKVKEGTMPWMNFKAKIELMNPYKLNVTQLQDTVVITDGMRIFTYDLVGGGFTASKN